MQKHGVHFADAMGALEDERALSEPDESSSEDRFKTSAWTFSEGSSWWFTRTEVRTFG